MQREVRLIFLYFGYHPHMTALIQKGMNNAQNAEFQNLKLAQIYEFFNQFSEDEDFWLRTVKELNISDITDFGCGT